MKYLLITIVALAFAGAATATSLSDCCDGSACCLVHIGCCAK